MKKLVIALFIIFWWLVYPVTADASESIIFSNETYGVVHQAMGVLITPPLTAPMVSELISLFGGRGVYLKVHNPSVSLINDPLFTQLSNSGFRWYFLFDTNSPVTGVLAAHSTHDTWLPVVELATVDTSFITSLKAQYPSLIIHAGYLPVWPREQVKTILTQLQPPTIEGVSFWIGAINQSNVFDDVKLTFDTFFDASKDIGGGVVINYPANTVLSVSDAQYPPYANAPEKTAYLSGMISSGIVSSVQSQDRSGKAPIRYMIPGNIASFTAEQKLLLAHFAAFMHLSPEVVWPKAINENGDPWDSPYISESDTKPVVGVIGRLADGTYYGFITNASNAEVTAKLANRINFASYLLYSTVRSGSSISTANGDIALQPYETVVIYPSSLPQPTITVAPTITPDTTCVTQKRIGDYDCSGVVNAADFDAWKTDFLASRSTVSFFEYWRRVMVW